MNHLVAKVETTINAPTAKVWGSLTKPEIIKQYMFGTNVISDWKVGSPIVWKGEWQGKSYEDTGTILKFEEGRILQYNYFSALTGKINSPENYQTITIELSDKGSQTVVTLSQDNHATDEDRKHSEKNWKMVLDGLKKLLEK